MNIEENQLHEVSKEYLRKGKKPVNVSFKKIFLKSLNGYHDNKKIHYIHSYPGRISPHIAFYILSLAEFKVLNGYVLDPFSGSGTILLESILNPIIKRPALGVEINPLARLIAKVKTSILDEKEIENSLRKIQKIYESSKRTDYKLPAFININLWFSYNAINKLAKLKFSIEKADINNTYKDFHWVCFSKIIRKVSKTDPNVPPPVVLKPEKYKGNPKEYKKLKQYLKSTETPKIWNLFETNVNENSKLSILNSIPELKNNQIAAKIISDNAKEILLGEIGTLGKIIENGNKKLANESIDIILTSPPYLTAQKYIRSTRLELLWLGYTTEELSQFERSTIGSEEVAKGSPINNFGIHPIDKLIKYTHKKSKLRGVMVYEYFAGMKTVLIELFRVLKKEGYAVFIMGDNVVLKKQVKTYRLLTDLAESLGFMEIVTFRDKIHNRSMLTKRNGTGGLIKYEYIIVLKK